MNKVITVVTSVLFLVCFSSVPAQADRKTMEGFMLGTGVAILGAAIINGMNDDDHPRYSRHHSPHPRAYIEYRHGDRDWGHHRGYRRHHNWNHHYRPDGRWEIVRIWVAPVYEKVWNPAHYDERGVWIEGRYEDIRVSEGYYQERRVWVD